MVGRKKRKNHSQVNKTHHRAVASVFTSRCLWEFLFLFDLSGHSAKRKRESPLGLAEATPHSNIIPPTVHIQPQWQTAEALRSQSEQPCFNPRYLGTRRDHLCPPAYEPPTRSRSVDCTSRDCDNHRLAAHGWSNNPHCLQTLQQTRVTNKRNGARCVLATDWSLLLKQIHLPRLYAARLDVPPPTPCLPHPSALRGSDAR